MESNTDKFKINIQMYIMVDVLWVIMSYYGWDGKDDSQASSKLLGTLITLRAAGIDKNLIIEMNDTGFSFGEIADYLDRIDKLNKIFP